jgi:hypothetical protein
MGLQPATPGCATDCFNDCMARDNSHRAGSSTSRCTCSGITTYPYMQRLYWRRTFSNEDSKTALDCALSKFARLR